MTILYPPTGKLKPTPTVGLPEGRPALNRVEFSELLPQPESVKFGKALVAAGWGLDVASVALVNGRRTAKLASLPLAFVDFLNAQGLRPSASRMEQMAQRLEADVLKLLPRVGRLLQ